MWRSTTKIRLFCKRDLAFRRAYSSVPHHVSAWHSVCLQLKAHRRSQESILSRTLQTSSHNATQLPKTQFWSGTPSQSQSFWYECIAQLIYVCMSHELDMCRSRFSSSKLPMGWLHVVGFLKLQVSFAKEPYERDDFLQKRPKISRSLLIVATP